MARERKTRSKAEVPESAMLVGKAARLRPLRAEDHAATVRWRNDPEIRDNSLGYRFPITEAMEADWVESVLKDQSRTRVVLAIEDMSDGLFVGLAYLNGIDWFSRHAEFGILIGERGRHGKGLARESLALVAGYAFRDLNLHRLHLRVAAFNTRALQLYRNFGFVEEGVQRQQAFVAGRYHDVVLFGLLRDEYEARRTG